MTFIVGVLQRFNRKVCVVRMEQYFVADLELPNTLRLAAHMPKFWGESCGKGCQ